MDKWKPIIKQYTEPAAIVTEPIACNPGFHINFENSWTGSVLVLAFQTGELTQHGHSNETAFSD